MDKNEIEELVDSLIVGDVKDCFEELWHDVCHHDISTFVNAFTLLMRISATKPEGMEKIDEAAHSMFTDELDITRFKIRVYEAFLDDNVMQEVALLIVARLDGDIAVKE